MSTKPRTQVPDSFDLTLVKEWADTCSKSHKRCSEKQENWYPTRLLHITSGGQQVRLIVSQDHHPKGQYMTLSHKWGENVGTKLQTSTMAQLQRAVVVPDLPPAFQDTIKIAAFMDIQYLWIDALCIKQDSDRSDWEIESLNMGKVYANAFLNVSATLAVKGTEPLFHNQGWAPIGPSEIKLKIKGPLKHFHVLNGDIWSDGISNAPLNNRGWVFQERFLARRVLHFSTRQLGWECRHQTALETFPKGLPANLETAVTKSSFHDLLAKVARHTRRRSVQDWLTTWHQIVEDYSRCLFTYPEDKLIAFAGIGAYISDFIGTEFVAGMLEKSLVYDLAWWRWTEDRKRFPFSNTSSRAPSWSWASVDGQINFPEDIYGTTHVLSFVENIKLIRNAGDLLGKQSHLRVRGICMPLRSKWSGEVIIGFFLPDLSALPERSTCGFTVEDSPQGSSIYYEVAIEEMHDLAERGHVLFLPLFLAKYFLSGILITKNRGKDSYRRIGAVHIPVRVESIPEDKKEIHKEIRLEQWREDTRVTQQGFPTVVWNNSGLRLIEYVQHSTFGDIEIL
jgi:hypothetical protein